MPISRSFRIATLGAIAGLSGAIGKAYVADSFVGSSLGGAGGAFAANLIPGLRFKNVTSVLLLGGIAGFIADFTSRRVLATAAPKAEEFEVLTGAFLLAGTGVFGAMSTESFFPQEVKLLDE